MSTTELHDLVAEVVKATAEDLKDKPALLTIEQSAEVMKTPTRGVADANRRKEFDPEEEATTAFNGGRSPRFAAQRPSWPSSRTSLQDHTRGSFTGPRVSWCNPVHSG